MNSKNEVADDAKALNKFEIDTLIDQMDVEYKLEALKNIR